MLESRCYACRDQIVCMLESRCCTCRESGRAREKHQSLPALGACYIWTCAYCISKTMWLHFKRGLKKRPAYCKQEWISNASAAVINIHTLVIVTSLQHWRERQKKRQSVFVEKRKRSDRSNQPSGAGRRWERRRTRRRRGRKVYSKLTQ